MLKKSIALSFLLIFSILLSACGNADAAIATGIAQTQQISELETAAAGGDATDTPQPTNTAESAPTEESSVSEVTTNQDVNMRSGDGTGYGVMTVIPGGEILQITAINPEGTWYQVAYHNASGWVATNVTTGTPPSGLPVVDPPPPQGGNSNSNGNSNNNNNNNGSTDYDDYFLALDYSDDQNHEVSGEVFGNLPSRITIRVEGMSGNDEGEIDIAFQCDTSEPEDVDISSSGASDNTICNNNWSYDVDADNDTVTIIVELDGGGSVEWTCIANVSPN
jgi:hypothetical protein